MNNGQCVTCMYNGTCTSDNKDGDCREHEIAFNEPESDFSGAWQIATLIFAALLVIAGTAGFIFLCDVW